MKLPIEIVDHCRDRRVTHNSFAHGADQRGSPAAVGAATDVVVAFGRICQSDERGDARSIPPPSGANLATLDAQHVLVTAS